jgi:hypothetical protein
MDYGEYFFGERRILIESRAQLPGRGNGSHGRYVATAYLMLNQGRELQAVGNREGRRLEVIADSDEEALRSMSSYLEKRFGERADAPELANEQMTRVQLKPPLKDDRDEATES